MARWQTTITDDAGNILVGALVTIRREVAGSPLAVLYSDRDGLVTIGNPLTADPEGYVFAHLVGGAYRITATHDGFTKTWRYVAVGLAGESDSVNAGVGFTFDAGVTDADPGVGAFRFNHVTPGSATKLFVSQSTPEGVDVSAWLATLDDGGSALNRGQLVIQGAGGGSLMIAMVTGTVVDDGLYFDVPISVIATTDAGSFVQDARFGMTLFRAGTDGTNGTNGTGTVNGPTNLSPTITPGELVLFADGTGNNIDGSGKTISTVGTGKQTIWIPAGAMVPRAANGAGTSTLDSGSNDITLPVLDFDQTTAEFAHFNVAFPKGWNKSAVTFRPFWTAVAGTAAQTAVIALAGVAISDDDLLNAIMGSPVSSSDVLIATTDLHVGPESAAIGIAGAPVDNDLCVFQVSRDVAADNLAADLKLIGIQLLYVTNLNTDD